MSFFTDAELDDLRAEQEASFDQTCTVRTFAAATVDAEGGTSPGTETDTETPCRIGVPTAQERQIAARLGQELDSTITVAWDVSVPITANVIVDSDTYEVITTNATQSYRAGLRLAVKRVT